MSSTTEGDGSNLSLAVRTMINVQIQPITRQSLGSNLYSPDSSWVEGKK